MEDNNNVTYRIQCEDCDARYVERKFKQNVDYELE